MEAQAEVEQRTEPGAIELPVSVVRRLVVAACPEGARFAPEAIEALARHAQARIAGVGAQALDVANARGRKTAQAEDVAAVLGPVAPTAEHKGAHKDPPGSHSRAETALARANMRLKKLGQAPELLGQFEASDA